MAFLAVLLLAQIGIPIERRGPSCPLGYYSAGSYCQPGSGVGRYRESIPRRGDSCPLGFYTEGRYCSRSYGPSW